MPFTLPLSHYLVLCCSLHLSYSIFYSLLFFFRGSFELVASIAASLGLVPLAVHGIFASTASIFYMIPQVILSKRHVIFITDV